MVGSDTFRALPLGGLGRIGGNLMVYETASDLIVVDCGICFPQADEPGVTWLIPTFDYLKQQRQKLRAVVVTHGHEDHIGALPFLLAELSVPIYGSRFTLALVEQKLAENELAAKLVPIQDRVPVQLGGFEVEPAAVTHSIPDAVALVLKTPAGVVVHSGDFKLDLQPLDGRLTDREKLAALGQKGVTALFSDSTNALRPGHTESERRVAEVLFDAIAAAPHRVLVTTFASNVFRLQAIITASEAAGRQVVPVGRSCRQMIQKAREGGVLTAPRGILAEPERCHALPRDRVTIIAAGCQAEEYSAFGTIARGEHSRIRLEPGDRALLSSRRIPGNEGAVARAVNALLRQGVDVVDDQSLSEIHASGHAQQDEQRELIDMLAPRIFVPIHGERRHLQAHANMARAAGVEAHLIEDGEPLDMERHGDQVVVRRGEPVSAGLQPLDGSAVLPEIVLRDRRKLGASGFVTCALWLDPNGQLLTSPQIITRGVVHVDASSELLAAAAREVERSVAAIVPQADNEEITDAARLALRRFFRRELQRRPVVVPAVTRLNGAR